MSVGYSMKRAILFISLSLGLAWAIAETTAGPVSVASADVAQQRQAIHSGARLEKSRDWLKAIEHYEEVLNSWPNQQELQHGLRRSKIHFGIERRYSDRSFQDSLLSLSEREAFRLFDDTVRTVQKSFVDPISMTSFVAHGTESLYLALANEKFATLSVKHANIAGVKQMRKVLREQYWNKPLRSLVEAQETIRQVSHLANSLLGIPASAVIMEYVFGGHNALDDYSNLLTPDRLSDLYSNIDGEFVGLGVEMKAEMGKGLLLVNVLPESPAAEGGILPGDHIVSIDDTECRYMTTDEAADLLRGPKNSKVRLGLEGPDSDTIRIARLVRRPVLVKSIPVVEMVDQNAGIGYIQMTGFQRTSATELDAALEKLDKQGMKAIIWDLRGNPGGLLTAAVEVLDRFIDEGVLVSTKGRTSDQNWKYSAHRIGTWNTPILLLVDGDSASASEIVAGAISDHRRGTIVGRKTYGKWSVQSIFPNRYSTGMRLTTAKFYSPHDRTFSKIGVRPDVVVDEVPAQHITLFRGSFDQQFESDKDIQKGLEILRSQLSSP